MEQINNGNEIESTVLLVEDDAFLAELLEKKLSQCGFKLFRASSVDDAQIILEKEKLNAILLDIMLPGVDGTVFLKDIKSNPRFKNIPVVIISNLGQKEEIKKGIEAGADFYLIKANTTTEEIASVLKNVIKNKNDAS